MLHSQSATGSTTRSRKTPRCADMTPEHGVMLTLAADSKAHHEQTISISAQLVRKQARAWPSATRSVLTPSRCTARTSRLGTEHDSVLQRGKTRMHSVITRIWGVTWWSQSRPTRLRLPPKSGVSAWPCNSSSQQLWRMYAPSAITRECTPAPHCTVRTRRLHNATLARCGVLAEERAPLPFAVHGRASSQRRPLL